MLTESPAKRNFLQAIQSVEVRTMEFFTRKVYILTFIIVVITGCYAQKEVKKKGLLPNQQSVAQNATVAGSDNSTLNSTNSSLSPLQKFLQEQEKEKQKRLKKQYEISAGDEIEISVWGEPEMTKTITVRPDGYISYFLIGEIKAEGKTIPQLKKEITARLSKYIRNPSVSIIARTFTSKASSVAILGAVAAPGLYTIKENTRLLDFLAMAHGLKYNSAGQPVYNLKASYLSRKGKLVPVDFSALLADGDMSQNILLESGDFIYIASSQARSAFVVGAVKMPQKVRFDVDITLLDAIATAGGLASGAKNTIYVVRDSLVHPEVLKVNYKNILKGKEKNIYLKPGDIVYVPRGFFSKISDLPNKILPFLNLIIQSDAAYNVLR